jgi:hypothetical protein
LTGISIRTDLSPIEEARTKIGATPAQASLASDQFWKARTCRLTPITGCRSREHGEMLARRFVAKTLLLAGDRRCETVGGNSPLRGTPDLLAERAFSLGIAKRMRYASRSFRASLAACPELHM